MPLRLISIDELHDQGQDLIRANWDEVGFDFECKPNWGAYRHLESLGITFVIGAFHEGALVGYSIGFVMPHSFNPDVVFCTTDSMCIAREHRGTLLPGRMLLATEQEARMRGAQYILWHTRSGTPLPEMLAARPEYKPADTVLMKEL